MLTLKELKDIHPTNLVDIASCPVVREFKELRNDQPNVPQRVFRWVPGLDVGPQEALVNCKKARNGSHSSLKDPMESICVPFVYPFFGGRSEDNVLILKESNWWRCRDLNPGHCGYEPHALTD